MVQEIEQPTISQDDQISSQEETVQAEPEIIPESHEQHKKVAHNVKAGAVGDPYDFSSINYDRIVNPHHNANTKQALKGSNIHREALGDPKYKPDKYRQHKFKKSQN